MDEVTADGESVEGVVFTTGVVGLEIEHDIERTLDSPGGIIAEHATIQTYYLGIARDDAADLVGKDGVAVITLPLLQVV